MTTKEYLSQVRRLQVEIENKKAQAAFWRSMAAGTVSATDGERVQSSGSGDKLSNSVVNAADLEAEAEKKKVLCAEKMLEIIATIERVENPTECRLLHLRYVQFKTWQEIADSYHKDYTWATTVHGRALKSVEAILKAQG